MTGDKVMVAFPKEEFEELENCIVRIKRGTDGNWDLWYNFDLFTPRDVLRGEIIPDIDAILNTVPRVFKLDGTSEMKSIDQYGREIFNWLKEIKGVIDDE